MSAAPGPAPATNLHVVAISPTSMTIGWTQNATGSGVSYEIRTRVTGTVGWNLRPRSTTGSQLTVSAAPATHYDVEVLAKNTMGTSTSAILQVTTPAQGVAPGPPTALTPSSITTSSVVLNWANTSIGTTPITYQVQQAPPGSPPAWVNVGSPVSGGPLSVSGLLPASSYQFQVVAQNSAGSTPSAEVSITTLAVLPTAPTGLAVVGSPTTTTVSLQWVASSAGTPPITYAVGFRQTLLGGAFVAGPTTAGTTATVTGLAAGTLYDFEVTASNGAGTSPPSAVLSGVSTQSGNVLPSAPQNLVSTGATQNSVSVSWTPPAQGTLPLLYTLQYRPH